VELLQLPEQLGQKQLRKTGNHALRKNNLTVDSYRRIDDALTADPKLRVKIEAEIERLIHG
jgi:hypothetical protein